MVISLFDVYLPCACVFRKSSDKFQQFVGAARASMALKDFASLKPQILIYISIIRLFVFQFCRLNAVEPWVSFTQRMSQLGFHICKMGTITPTPVKNQKNLSQKRGSKIVSFHFPFSKLYDKSCRASLHVPPPHRRPPPPKPATQTSSADLPAPPLITTTEGLLPHRNVVPFRREGNEVPQTPHLGQEDTLSIFKPFDSLANTSNIPASTTVKEEGTQGRLPRPEGILRLTTGKKRAGDFSGRKRARRLQSGCLKLLRFPALLRPEKLQVPRRGGASWSLKTQAQSYRQHSTG